MLPGAEGQFRGKFNDFSRAGYWWNTPSTKNASVVIIYVHVNQENHFQ